MPAYRHLGTMRTGVGGSLIPAVQYTNDPNNDLDFQMALVVQDVPAQYQVQSYDYGLPVGRRLAVGRLGFDWFTGASRRLSSGVYAFLYLPFMFRSQSGTRYDITDRVNDISGTPTIGLHFFEVDAATTGDAPRGLEMEFDVTFLRSYPGLGRGFNPVAGTYHDNINPDFRGTAIDLDGQWCLITVNGDPLVGTDAMLDPGEFPVWFTVESQRGDFTSVALTAAGVTEAPESTLTIRTAANALWREATTFLEWGTGVEQAPQLWKVATIDVEDAEYVISLTRREF